MSRARVATALAAVAALVPALPALPAAAAAPYSAIVVDTADAVTVADEAGGWTVDATADASGAITVTATRSGSASRSVTLRPPTGLTAFAPGRYPLLAQPDATSAAVSVPSAPCASPTGTLDVLAVRYGEDGAPAELAAGFDLGCGAGGTVHGEVRHDAAEPYRAAVAAGSMHFGNVGTATPATRTVTLTGFGSAVTAGAAVVTGSAAFSVVRDTCAGAAIDPGGTCQVDIRFAPSAGGHTGRLSVPVDTRRGALAVPLSGTGVAPPNPPGGFSVMAGSDGVALRWTSVAGVTIRVIRDGVVLADGLSGYSGVYYDRPLPLGSTHSYALVALSAYGRSEPTETLTATTPSTLPEPGSRRALAIEIDGMNGDDPPPHMRADAAGDGADVRATSYGPGTFDLGLPGGLDGASFARPPDVPFTPGEFPVSATPGPGVARVWTLPCRGVSEGTLLVHEASQRADGTPDVFSATYDGTCGTGSVRIEARWNSDRDHEALVARPNSAHLYTPLKVGQVSEPVSFTLVNSGSLPRSLAAATAGGAAAGDWTFDSSSCTAGPLAPGASCTVTGRFAPKAAGTRAAALEIGGRSLHLLGYGLSAPGTPVVTATPIIGRIRLSWPPVDSGGPGTVSYHVMRGSSFLAVADAPQYDVRPELLPRGVPLTFSVYALGPGGRGASSAPVTVPMPYQQMIFVDPDMVTMAPPGNLALRIGSRQTGATEPAASPDGSHFVYVVETPGGDHLWIRRTDLQGGGAALTSGATVDRQPAWSPDGTKLAFTREDASGAGVRIRWMSGDQTVAWVAGGPGASSPTWLPSGRELAVIRHGRTPYVEILSLDGTRAKVAGTDGAIQAAVSPDGARVAFVHGRVGSATTIRVVPVAGGVPVTVANLGGFAQNPSWSDDGTRLYFDSAPLAEADTVGNADLYAVPAAGGAPRNLTNTPDRNETHPVLATTRAAARPTGSRLAADFNGDGRAEPAVFRPVDGRWHVLGMPAVQWGRVGDIPVPGDYNGDRRADLAVYRPSNGTWYVRGVGTYVYGQPGDVPVPADYNGDRRADVAIFRPSTGGWHVRLGPSWTYGNPGDIPVPADYTGDGRADPAVYRPATAEWYVLNHAKYTYNYLGAVPAPADLDGDRRADVALYDPYGRRWVFANRPAVAFGAFADIAVPGDFNGDRRADLAVFRPATGTWYVRGVATVRFGQRGDEAV